MIYPILDSPTSSIILLMIHIFFLGTVTISLVFAAHQNSGPLVSWPIGLRWMLAILFMLYVVTGVNNVVTMFRDTTYDTVYNLIKIAVIPLEFAIAWRLYRGGLYLDRSEREKNAISSVNHPTEQWEQAGDVALTLPHAHNDSRDS